MAIRTHIGAGARRYRALVGLPAARWPLVFSIAGSMPIGMYGLAILLLVRDAHGSFAVAGHVAMLLALVVAAGRGAPAWALALLAFGAGACLPQVPAAMRSLWSALVA